MSVAPPTVSFSTRAGIAATLLAFVLLSTSTAAGEHPTVAAAANETPATPFDQLIADYTAFADEKQPLPLPDGTDARYAKRLEAIDESYFTRRAEKLQGFIERLSAIDRPSLGRDERIDADILATRLQNTLGEIEHRAYRVPIGSREGFHIAFASEVATRSFSTVEHYDDYVARLQSFRAFAERQTALMRLGLRTGWTMSAQVLDGYGITVRPLLVDDVTTSDFYAPFARIPASFDEADRTRLLRDGTAAIRDSVLPAYRAFLSFLEDEYIPSARQSLGMSAMPGGRAFYEHRVRRYTTLDLTPEAIHQLGLDEVARIRGEMAAIMAEVDFTDSFEAFIDFLRTDARFYVDTSEDYLRAVSYAAKRMDGKLPELFGTLPRSPYGIRAIPPLIAPRLSAGYYDRGEGDGSRAGFVNVNTSQLDSRPLYVAEALAFHEGVPGHHLQIMLVAENETLSDFRKEANSIAFVEGWALYAERLGLEAGLYDDPYANFGRLTYEIWRAVRLVVDTGVHALDWTRDQAIAYMAENTGMALGPSTAEVDRHITEPGQGLAYKIGELAIRRLRTEAEETLGARFDRRAFHDQVLRHGAVPLFVLEREVRAWIAEVEADEAAGPES